MNDKRTEKTPLRVLYLEDSPRDIEIVRESLTEAGFDLALECAEEKSEYVSLLRSRKYDVILCDFRLPHFDAFGALQLSIDICPDVPLICVSGTIGEETAVDLIRKGAVDYVSKDRLVRLPLVIRRAVDEVNEKKSRRLAEEALRESEEKYRRIIETTGTGFVILDEKGRVLEANAEYVRLSGHQNLQEILGRSVLEWTVREEGDRNAREIANCLEQGFVRNLEISYEGPNGERVPIEIDARAVEDQGIRRILSICRDISERKRAEEAVHYERNLLRTLIDNLPEAVYVKDKVGRKTVANKADVRWVGCQSEEEVLGRTDFEFYPPEASAAYYADDQSVIQSGKAVLNKEEIITDKDGTKHWFSTSKVPLRNPEGQIVGLVGVGREITDSKQAEADLRESEEKYHAFFESSMDAILLTSSDGSIQAANPAACKMLGRTEAEICAAGRAGLVDSNDPRLNVLLEERARTGRAFGELTMVRKDGSSFPVEVSSAVFRNKQGNVRTSMIIRDITERKRAEEAARASTDRQSLILQSLPIVFYTSRPSGDFATTWINEQVEHLTGFRPHQFIEDSMFWSKRLHPDDRDQALKEYELMLQNGRVAIEYRWQCADGKYRWFVDQAVVAKDEQGNPNRVTGIWLDITDRKRAEEELRRLTHAIEQSPVSVVVTDAAGDIEYVNPKFTEITGYSMEEVRGKNPRILKSGETGPEEYKKLWDTILAGGVWRGEFHNKKKSGEMFWESASISPVRDGQRVITHFIAIKEDITTRKQAEDKLEQNETRRRELERELAQAQKLESLGTLASGIAHDFNNLLGIIMGHASLMEAMNPDGPALLKKNTDAILKAATRGASLVKQMLTFARKTDVLIESVALNDIVNEVGKLMRETFPRTISVESHLAEDLPLIDADATQVHQVLLNLCLNARDAMASGGMLTISTYRQSSETLLNKYPKAIAESYVVLSVADTGFGMDEETQRRIFEPFFTTKEHGKGTGLGLSLVFGIMESHNGFITFQSEPGKGTTFQCYFPVPNKALEVPPVEEAEMGETPGGSETILVVEDEELLRDLLKDTLEPKGYTVLTAEDGEKGLEMYQNHREEITLVVSDLGLPRFGGDELYRKLARVNPHVRLVLSSGYIEPGMKAKILKEGVKDFIEKPYNSNEVLRVIRNVLERE